MANLTDQQREQNRLRQQRKGERSVARDIAQRHAAEALAQLVAGGGPEWFTHEQRIFYDEELQRLRYRIDGCGSVCSV